MQLGYLLRGLHFPCSITVEVFEHDCDNSYMWRDENGNIAIEYTPEEILTMIGCVGDAEVLEFTSDRCNYYIAIVL